MWSTKVKKDFALAVMEFQSSMTHPTLDIKYLIEQASEGGNGPSMGH